MSQIGQFTTGTILPDIETLTGDAGGAVGPSAGGNVNVVGGNNITTTGTPLTNTLSIAVTGTTQYSLQLGNATNSLSSLGVAANGQIPIGSTGADPVLAVPTNGNNVTWTVGAGTLRADVTGTTDHSIQLGNATGSLSSLGVATNGQIPIGSNAADPVLAAPTNGTNISWTVGAGTLQADLVATVAVSLGGTGATSITDHSLIVGSGTAAVTELGVATNGQIPIGSNGADPVLAVPTNGNNVTWTVGAGTLRADVTGTTDHSIQLGNATGSLSSLGVATNGQIPIGSNGADPVLATITGSGAINVSNGAGTITISGGGTSWSIITADLDPMVVYSGYICNKAGLLTMTLPATSAVGTTLSVTGINTDVGWRIAQRAGQQIHFGNQSTTAGVGGYLESTHRRDSVDLVCVVADTEWNIISSIGNVTIA